MRYRNYTHHSLYRSCLLVYGIAIVGALSFPSLDDLEENVKISIAIKSGFTVVGVRVTSCSRVDNSTVGETDVS